MVLATVLAFVFGSATGVALCRSWFSLERGPMHVTPDELARLRLAEHWGRGGVLSARTEPWYPACTALAIAALSVRDLAELDALLRAQVGTIGSDPEVVNVFRQALAELVDTTRSGKAHVSNDKDWPTGALLVRATEVIGEGCDAADRLVRKRRSP